MTGKKFGHRTLLAGLVITGAALAAQMPASAETTTVEVPIYSTKAYGPTRLISVHSADTVRPGMTIFGGHVWANNLGGVAGTNMDAHLNADFGITPRMELGIGAGIMNSTSGALTAHGKYLFMSEAYAGNPLSLALLASLGVDTNFAPNVVGGTLINTGPNLRFGLGLPLTKSLTENISVTAVPGLQVNSLSGVTAVAGALGLGLDFGINDRFRILLDSNFGFPTTGFTTNSAAGIRYAFTRDFTTDLFVGYNTMNTGAGILVATPAVGLGGNIRF